MLETVLPSYRRRTGQHIQESVRHHVSTRVRRENMIQMFLETTDPPKIPCTFLKDEWSKIIQHHDDNEDKTLRSILIKPNVNVIDKSHLADCA